MRWFKHLSDASGDEFISSLEAGFGLDGYARWWKLLEAIAARMKPTDTRAKASLPRSEWLRILRCKRKQLDTFLEAIANEQRIILSETGNILQIECPKLLKFRDEYARKSGHSPDATPDKLPGKIESLDSEIRGQKRKGAIPSEARAKGAHELPEEWRPTPEDLEWATLKRPRVNLDEQTERFKNHHIGKGGRWKDWSRAWRNWISGAFVINQDPVAPGSRHAVTANQETTNEPGPKRKAPFTLAGSQ